MVFDCIGAEIYSAKKRDFRQVSFKTEPNTEELLKANLSMWVQNNSFMLAFLSYCGTATFD
jgi:hypothetical protein